MSGNRWYTSLRFRLAGMLTIALLPIGLIAVNQTKTVATAAQDAAEIGLLAMTAQAASVERQSIERARGAADAIRAALPTLENDAECSEFFANVLMQNPRFSFVGLLPRDGQMTCSSAGKPYDFTNFPGFENRMKEQTASLEINLNAPLSGTSVLIVSEPIFQDEEFIGYVSISLPHSRLSAETMRLRTSGLTDLMTFNSEGEVITSIKGLDTAEERLPTDVSLSSFLNKPADAFTTLNASGKELSYAVVPIENSRFYALGVWEAEEFIVDLGVSNLPASFFPLTMWLVSLGVALFAIHSLVSRHVRVIDKQMSLFATTRQFSDFTLSSDAPSELREIQSSFESMAQSILRDEADLEDAMRHKNVLFREVHHRVKNNLQLISSIINMQVRKSEHTETKQALRRIQERVISLATVHRDLYQNNSGGRVKAGTLVKEVVNSTLKSDVDVDIKIKSNFEEILLFPDQAIPLSLFAAEAATNALKFAGATEGSAACVEVFLTETEGGPVRFEISNSVATEVKAESTGLGSQLLNAFAMQLGGHVETSFENGVHMLAISFTAAEFEAEQNEY